jgi:hypothetical protein
MLGCLNACVCWFTSVVYKPVPVPCVPRTQGTGTGVYINRSDQFGTQCSFALVYERVQPTRCAQFQHCVWLCFTRSACSRLHCVQPCLPTSFPRSHRLQHCYVDWRMRGHVVCLIHHVHGTFKCCEGFCSHCFCYMAFTVSLQRMQAMCPVGQEVAAVRALICALISGSSLPVLSQV